MRKYLSIVVFLLCSGFGWSQQGDLISTSYVFVPSQNNQVDFSQSRTLINLPTKLKKGVLLQSVSFDYYKLNYDANLLPFTESIERFYAMNYRVNYIRSISKNWQFGTSFLVGTQSNFRSSISSEDFNLGGGLFFAKNSLGKQSRSRLVIGLNFSNALGEPRLLPMIGYTKIYNNGNAFALGFPNTFYNYQLNSKTSLKALLDFQGFYANVGDQPRLNQDENINKAFFLSAGLGLELKRKIDANWLVFLKSTYAFLNDYTLLNEAETEIIDFGLDPVFYISTGVTFNINRKQNNLK
jgi:hypothetical protein